MSFGSGWGLNHSILLRCFLSLPYPQDQALFGNCSQAEEANDSLSLPKCEPITPAPRVAQHLLPLAASSSHSEHIRFLTIPLLLLNGGGWLSGKLEDLLRAG